MKLLNQINHKVDIFFDEFYALAVVLLGVGLILTVAIVKNAVIVAALVKFFSL